MPTRRYEILLPLTYNNGELISQEKFLQTREEIISRFHGVSTAPGTVRGTWIHDGTRYEDESFRYFVDVEDTPEARQAITDLKLLLRERFQQIEIYIVSYPIEII